MFEQLPEELNIHILSNLKLQDLGQVVKVSRGARRNVKNEQLWKSLVSRDVGNITRDEGTWFQTYRSRKERTSIYLAECICPSSEWRFVKQSFYRTREDAIKFLASELASKYLALYLFDDERLSKFSPDLIQLIKKNNHNCNHVCANYEGYDKLTNMVRRLYIDRFTRDGQLNVGIAILWSNKRTTFNYTRRLVVN